MKERVGQKVYWNTDTRGTSERLEIWDFEYAS